MPQLPDPESLYASPKVASVAGPLAVTNAVVTSFATSTSIVTILSAGLNGALGASFSAAPGSVLPRTVTVTTSAVAATYATGSGNAIVVTGTNEAGATITENLVLTAAGGGQTIVGLQGFVTIASIVIPAQLGAGGAFTFGVQDVVLPSGCRWVFVGTPGAAGLHISNSLDGVADTVPNAVVKGAVNGMLIAPAKIWGDTAIADVTILF